MEVAGDAFFVSGYVGDLIEPPQEIVDNKIIARGIFLIIDNNMFLLLEGG
jgi:hypothetical protein